MNDTNEPKVALPEPPEGMKWEYRGMGWKSEKPIQYCFLDGYGKVIPMDDRETDGDPNHHYWEAVPAPKTVKQWLETLPDGYRERALANCERGNADYCAASLSSAIRSSFDWQESQEKHDFWKSISDWAINPNKNPLPLLPEAKPTREELERENAQLKAELAEENRKLRKKLEVAEQALIDFKEDWSSRVKQAKNLERENAQLKAELAALKSPCVMEDKYDGVSLGEALAAYPPPESERPEKPAPPDHTEGGKYRMLEEGELICEGDTRFDGAVWVPTHIAGEQVNDGTYRRPVTPQPDYAQRAKDMLQAKFVGGFPTFREISLDQFVDLIIKAAKQ
jgi:hypothetical protein